MATAKYRMLKRAKFLERLLGLPGPVAFAFRGDIKSHEHFLDDLAPKEAAHIAGAISERRLEFAAGRCCARRALAILGIGATPILPDNHGVPLWPPGVVGSITHTDGFCAAMVAQVGQILSLGIDAERALPPAATWRYFCTPDELDWIADIPSQDQPTAARAIFSAKESFFKCYFPVTRRQIGFHHISLWPCPDVSIAALSGFEVELRRNCGLCSIRPFKISVDHADHMVLSVSRFCVEDQH